MIVLYATVIDSPPSPKRTRPRSMTVKLFWKPPNMKRHYPAVTRIVKSIRPTRIPILSRKMPPKSGRITFGAEYTVKKRDH